MNIKEYVLKNFYGFKAKRDLKPVLASIDLNEFKKYQKKFKDADPAPGASKYLDISYWMEKKLYDVYALGLHRSKPVNIFDIGTGFGYFPYLCNHFGHNTVALDLDETEMYNEVVKFLNIDRRTMAITAYEKLPDLGCKFDLITAFSICFNGHNNKGASLWGVDEWDFLLNDLVKNHMNEGGKMLWKLNLEAKTNRYYTENLLKYFLSKGATVNGRSVYFSSIQEFLK